MTSGQFLVQFTGRRAIENALKLSQHKPIFDGVKIVEGEDTYKTRHKGAATVKAYYDGYSIAMRFFLDGIETSPQELEKAIDEHIASL